MRYRITLDDELLARAKQMTGLKTEREVIHTALRLLILVNEQAEIRKLRGQLHWEGDLDTLRIARQIHDGE